MLINNNNFNRLTLNFNHSTREIIVLTSQYDYMILHVHEIGKYNFDMKEGQLSIPSKEYKDENTQFSPGQNT